ncbi:MAG: hypothetical protein DVB22_002145 [Verrucomicrobia bacterium]|nr:MAG: hypothetical protein DVB22_002145 [Verrucomicrobiota bacterium]
MSFRCVSRDVSPPNDAQAVCVGRLPEAAKACRTGSVAWMVGLGITGPVFLQYGHFGPEEVVGQFGGGSKNMCACGDCCAGRVHPVRKQEVEGEARSGPMPGRAAGRLYSGKNKLRGMIPGSSPNL